MTARELRLRERIDTLTDERDDALRRTRRRILGLGCLYCGRKRARGCTACSDHRDLLALDPHYAL